MRPLATQRLGRVPGWWLRIAGAACLRRTRMCARTAIMIAASRARSGPVSVAAEAAALPDPALLAAIMIAVRAHIRVRRKQAAPAMRSHQPGTLPSRWVASGRTRQNRSWAPGGRYV